MDDELKKKCPNCDKMAEVILFDAITGEACGCPLCIVGIAADKLDDELCEL